MDYKLDPVTGDLAIERQDLVMVTGAAAAKQAARIRLRTFKGEWFLDVTIGLLEFKRFFGKGGSLADRRARVRAALLATPGIISVESIDLTLDRATGKLRIVAKGTGDDGPLDLTNEVNPP